MKLTIQWFLGIVFITAAYAVGVVAIILCMPFCFLWHILATIKGFITIPERNS